MPKYIVSIKEKGKPIKMLSDMGSSDKARIEKYILELHADKHIQEIKIQEIK